MNRSLRAGAVLLLILSVTLIAACNRGAEKAPEPAADPTENANPVEDATQPDASEGAADEPVETSGPLRQLIVDVYFPSAFSDGLVGEPREIFDTATPGDRAKQIIADLIAGPSDRKKTRAVPQGVILRQVYVLENGVAYLDFSAELTDEIRGGSMHELLLVYSIVNSVTLNVQGISRVAILINGRPVESLNGHLDLRRPLPPDRKMILRG